jgi:membrane fusion protein (multidrug efflux system)
MSNTTATPADFEAAPASPRRLLKRGVLALTLLGGAAVAADYGYSYWTVGRFLESTDDAYVKADYTTVAPKVSGYITDVLVADNQPVKAGAVLARIDDRDFRTALARAQAARSAIEAGIRNLEAQIALQQSVIAAADAQIASRQATLVFARQDRKRYWDLMKTGTGTVQKAQQSDAALREAEAALAGSAADLEAAQKKVDVLRTQRAEADAQLAEAAAQEKQAELNLSYTTITAPVDGTVGARTLRVGQFVQAGTQLMAVVPLHAAYIVANFKETQLGKVNAGQPVDISVDALPDLKLRGHVDSLSPASGLEFSLLPPDNATGNFTKIVQRIPVKIVLDGDAAEGLLRSGMSVEPVIDTRGAATAG